MHIVTKANSCSHWKTSFNWISYHLNLVGPYIVGLIRYAITHIGT